MKSVQFINVKNENKMHRIQITFNKQRNLISLMLFLYITYLYNEQCNLYNKQISLMLFLYITYIN